MTIRNLDFMFRPASLAVVGASERDTSVGGQVTRNVLSGGFEGRLYPVNPGRPEVFGHTCYPGIDELPEAPDLAVIATPPGPIPGIVAELGKKGTKAAVVITAGFGEGDEEGRKRRQALLDAAQPHMLRLLGPNCIGLMLPGIGLNASFAHANPRAGRIGFASQSGAVVTSVLDWANASGIGFSHLISLGNMADVDFGDVVDYLALDPATAAILLYVENITDTRKFMSAARAAARHKPVIVLKSGRHAAGAKAAASHTGAMAGADEVYDAAFRRAGLLRVEYMEELFDAVEALAVARPPRGDRLAILSNGGGIAVIATDTLVDFGGSMAELSPATIKALDKVLPPVWSGGNPVDIIGDAPGTRYAESLKILAEDDDVGGILILKCPTALASGLEAAKAVVATGVDKDHCVLTSWLGEAEVREARRLFTENRIPTFETPSQGVRAFSYLVRRRQARDQLLETPRSAPAEFEPDRESARGIIDHVLSEGRDLLTEPEAKAVLAAYDIPVGRTETAADPEAAARTAAALGFPVALKILSREITHKSDVGGVALDLTDEAAVRETAEQMLERVAKARPGAAIDGFTVQDMIRRPGAHELILGAAADPQFGPVILFGAGGVSAEVVADKALGLPPLNLSLGRRLMEGTRIHKLMLGYRDRPRAALDDVALVLVKLSQLLADFAEVAELDINPLLADEKGVIAVDARVRVEPAPAGHAPAARFAIRPYPSELEEDVPAKCGPTAVMRPVRPADEAKLSEALDQMTGDDLRMRVFAPLKSLTREMAARLTQIDYNREMALVLADDGAAGEAPIHGIARMAFDPNFETAEFALAVRADEKDFDAGPLLMAKLIGYARSRGLKTLFGEVLADNKPVLDLCKKLGFKAKESLDEPGELHLELTL